MSEDKMRPRKAGRFLVMLFFISNHALLLTAICHAAIFDRVVAYVDNQAITMSEFRAQFEKTRAVAPDITQEEVLNTMVNRVLLLREAKKYRIEALSPEESIREYVDLKVKAFIRISEGEMEDFFMKNIGQFEGRDFEQAREEIERYLTEKELNERLKETIAALRRNATIKMQLAAD